MDPFGGFLKLGAATPTSAIPYEAQSTAEQAGHGAHPMRASERGTRGESVETNGSIRTDVNIHGLRAKVHQFRYNTISSSSMRACSDLKASTLSHDFAVHENEYNKWSRDWQHAAFGIPARDDKANDEKKWFPAFVSFGQSLSLSAYWSIQVEAMVSQYNTKAFGITTRDDYHRQACGHAHMWRYPRSPMNA